MSSKIQYKTECYEEAIKSFNQILNFKELVTATTAVSAAALASAVSCAASSSAEMDGASSMKNAFLSGLPHPLFLYATHGRKHH